MPSYIVKPERDKDFYVLWSTVTDSPHAWGTRQELSEDGDGFLGHRTYAAERFERADEFGTSDLSIRQFGWEDAILVVMNMPKNGILKRSDLRKYLDSLVVANGAALSADDSLITPFPD